MLFLFLQLNLLNRYALMLCFFSWRTLYFNFLYTNFKKSGPELVMMSFAAKFGDLLQYPEEPGDDDEEEEE